MVVPRFQRHHDGAATDSVNGCRGRVQFGVGFAFAFVVVLADAEPEHRQAWLYQRWDTLKHSPDRAGAGCAVR